MITAYSGVLIKSTVKMGCMRFKKANWMWMPGGRRWSDREAFYEGCPKAIKTILMIIGLSI
jgi:hypothetical protein